MAQPDPGGVGLAAEPGARDVGQLSCSLLRARLTR
jgi:hypothetical protein